ncbi:ABC transporter permease [Spongiactinospora sp. TRM90649]|uniref:ABC transporter permease n=1 Tax=Spongiactinospora sp. TRM90649 TaxID=3031114 RepID=UPI0023F948DF|nr:ABC transporter permease [Spongiactinospora sp. TRM90649]MDF5754663.1 ABC transporter permease [Spongiactinospora sp. TRM90649]
MRGGMGQAGQAGAVWRVARAAIRRRAAQSVVIGLVVLFCAITTTLALGLLDAATAPFDRAFAAQRGAHAVVAFDTGTAGDEALARTARRPGVVAAAGPFDQVVIDLPRTTDIPEAEGSLRVVGRPGPGGPVDRVVPLRGRWATAPGEIVLNLRSAEDSGRHGMLGAVLRAPGVPPLRVVGVASSMSRSADAWVTPAQMAALRPSGAQMLYRFADASSEERVSAGVATATAGLPPGSITVTQSYLALRRVFSGTAAAYLPFIASFGGIGLVVAVLIVANVISGAVVSGVRHIGVLKAVGFTPNQVVAVYLTMVTVPAVAGCAVGTLAGWALTEPVLQAAFAGIDMGAASVAVSPWVPVACLLGMPLMVIVAALVPALRAHRLPAARAISAGSAPRPGRGLRVQRALGGAPLPRAVSLGLGQPFARPGRSALTMASVVLGVATVTLTTGLAGTMIAFAEADRPVNARIGVRAGEAAFHEITPRHGDRETEALLRSLPGAAAVTAKVFVAVRFTGLPVQADVNFQRGDAPALAAQVVEGRWARGPGELVASPGFLRQSGLAVGDALTLELNGRRSRAVVVGRLMAGEMHWLYSSWATLTTLSPKTRADQYEVALTRGSDPQAYARAVRMADPGLYPAVTLPDATATTIIVGFATGCTVLLIVVAALGVFNTVLLNTHDRRRDLGMLKSIGMTPRQVVVMTVTSMAVLGAVGGLLGIPAGVVGHRLLVENVGIVTFPAYMKDVWHLPALAALGLAGVAIAVLGALLPARSAARLKIAAVLHNE